MVIFKPLPSFNFKICWITPFPYVVVPTIFAFPKSFSAPAKISDALAVFSLVSITIGIFTIGSSFAFFTVSLPFLSTSYNKTESLGVI